METQSILNEYDKMISFSNDQLVKSILELDDNIEIFKNYDLLLRIQKSLQHYIGKKSGLIYIGLMGHFSNGKSSLINALLDLDGNEAREVGRHPTDKGITLITHPDNETSFIKLGYFGNIPVKLQTVKNDLLKNIVLIDTPGDADTDPLIVSELMQDYLPICDLLLYLLNTTNPIDKNDIPFLKEKEKNLSLIQTKYIFTRADDLRIDLDKEITEANFNALEANRFLSIGISRIEQIIKGIQLTDKDFYFVDNIKKFRISELRNFLQEFASTTNIENQLKLHEHKLNFYRRIGIKVRSAFFLHIQNKILTLKKYVEDANKNISRYEHKVRISNNELSKTWGNYQNEIEKITDRNIQDLQEPTKFIVYSSIWETPEFKKLISNIYLDVNYIDTSVTDYLSNSLNQSLNQNKHLIQEFKDQITKISLNDYPIIGFDLQRIEVKDLNILNISFPVLIKMHFDKIEKELFQSVQQLYDKLKTEKQSLSYRLKNSQPLSELTEIIDNAIKGLIKDIDDHFYNVYLYRTGVFAEHVKEYISRLGIGNKLNQLESEFNDDFKDKIKTQAKEMIFPGYETKINNYLKEIKNLKSNFDNPKIDLLDVDLNRDNFDKINTESVLHNISISLKEKLSEILTHKIKSRLQKIKNHIEEHISYKWNDYKLNREKLRKERRTKFFTYISIGLGIAMLYWIFKLTKLNDNVANNFILSIASNIIIPIALIITAFIKDKYAVNLNIVQADVKNQIIIYSLGYIDTEIKKANENSEEKILINSFYQEAINKQIQDIKSQSLSKSLESIYLKLTDIRKEEYSIRKKYIEEITSISKSFLNYLEYDDKKLENISREIKDEAIQPSFLFLESLEKDLLSVQSKIEEIKFS